MEPSRNDIWKMFEEISPTYDVVNRAMTLGLDLHWRRKMVDFLPSAPSLKLLDCACGTGDQLIALLQKREQIIEAVGLDLAPSMLALAKEKIRTKSFRDKVAFCEGSALAIPFSENTFHCATMSFGIRNVTDVPLCLQEMHRVLCTGGRLLILECSLPESPLAKKLHLFYIRHVLPLIGRLLSKHHGAYVYLNQTIETFPSGDHFCQLLRDNLFKNVQRHPLFGGVVTIYRGDKE